MTHLSLKSAIAYINQHGALLVFPIKTNAHVPSLWKCFHPRTTMRWEWTDDSGDQVPELWHLREELSRSRKVIYAKWFQGRATFFSIEVFTALLSSFIARDNPLEGLDQSALRLYRALSDDSPLPTKALREISGYSGRENEAAFQRALRTLWRRLLLVGYGEVDEGGFPSLAVGCSKLLFEEHWDRATQLSESTRQEILERRLPSGSPFLQMQKRIIKGMQKDLNS